MKKFALYIYCHYLVLLGLGSSNLLYATCYGLAKKKKELSNNILNCLKAEEVTDYEPFYQYCVDYAAKYPLGSQQTQQYAFLSLAIFADASKKKGFIDFLFHKILNNNIIITDGIRLTYTNRTTLTKDQFEKAIKLETKALPGHLRLDYIEKWITYIGKIDNAREFNINESAGAQKKDAFLSILKKMYPKATKSYDDFYKALMDTTYVVNDQNGTIILARQIRRELGDAYIKKCFYPLSREKLLLRGGIVGFVIVTLYILLSYVWLIWDLEDMPIY